MKYNNIIKAIFFCLLLIIYSCNEQSGTNKDKSIFEKANSKKLVIERWGNYNLTVNDNNFREFYYYDSLDNLVRHKQFFFDDSNINCEIIDTSLYRDTYYEYVRDDSGYQLTRTISFELDYSVKPKPKRKLEYIYDDIEGKFIYGENSIEGSLRDLQETPKKKTSKN